MQGGGESLPFMFHVKHFAADAGGGFEGCSPRRIGPRRKARSGAGGVPARLEKAENKRGAA